jgi:hypothetical protein
MVLRTGVQRVPKKSPKFPSVAVTFFISANTLSTRGPLDSRRSKFIENFITIYKNVTNLEATTADRFTISQEFPLTSFLMLFLSTIHSKLNRPIKLKL